MVGSFICQYNEIKRCKAREAVGARRFTGFVVLGSRQHSGSILASIFPHIYKVFEKVVIRTVLSVYIFCSYLVATIPSDTSGLSHTEGAIFELNPYQKKCSFQ